MKSRARVEGIRRRKQRKWNGEVSMPELVSRSVSSTFGVDSLKVCFGISQQRNGWV